MNSKQKRVIRLEYHKPHCWCLVSPIRRDASDPEFSIDYVLSFFYDGGEWGAEWEPRHGPIQVWHKCEEGTQNAAEHYFYDWHDTPPASWSQLAVTREGLHEAFMRADYDYIFHVLRSWTNRPPYEIYNQEEEE